MKSLTAKTLTTAAVLGAALLATAGTSHADGLLPDGAKVVGHGAGATESLAISNAIVDAGKQCASGAAAGRPDGTPNAQKLGDGTWKATYTTYCLPPSNMG